MILKENIDSNINIIKNEKINNLDELQKIIKDKGKVLEFSIKSGLSEQYLSVLRRALNGYKPKPNRIKDFPSITDETVRKLESCGIKKTTDIYNKILTEKNRKELSAETGINEKEINELSELTDLSRIKWVNHTFANVLLKAGYNTVKKVADADYQEMYEKIKQINIELELYKGNIGAHDMKLCVESAQTLDIDIVLS